MLLLLLVAGFNLLERPDNPTRTDFAVVKVVLDELKEHVKEGHCDKFLTVAEKSKFLKLGTPPVSRIRTSNYGSVKLELKVFARYAGITLFVLDPFKPTVQGKNNEGHPIGVFDVNPHITYIVGARDAQMKCVPPPSSPPLPPFLPPSLSSQPSSRSPSHHLSCTCVRHRQLSMKAFITKLARAREVARDLNTAEPPVVVQTNGAGGETGIEQMYDHRLW